jgi:hypothetical protein
MYLLLLPVFRIRDILRCFQIRILESALQRQFRLYIPFLGIARPQPQFLHSCVCERFDIFPGSVHIFPQAETAAPSWEYIIRSQTHECGNGWGLRPRYSFSGNICFEFLAFFLCSAYNGKPDPALFVRSFRDANKKYFIRFFY